VITGFNTDIPYEGVTYHVQTEDKGLETPLILSLVYVGGTIIASKRTPYSDLVESGYDEGVLTERLQRQHKLICAAIRAGRVDDLKKMAKPPGGKGRAEKGGAKDEGNGAARGAARVAAPEAPKEAPKETPVEVPQEEAAEVAPAAEPAPTEGEFVFGAWEPAAPAQTTPAPPAVEAPTLIEEEWVTVLPDDVIEEEEEGDQLYLHLLDDEGEFRAGQLATIKVQVGRGPYGRRPAADASVMIKVLGTSFRPLMLSARTDAEGVAVVRALLPRFTSGRAAIIIRASAGSDSAELRRIIHQY
jgi:hypothetical protein